MPEGSPNKQSPFSRLRDWAAGGPPSRPSLFHYVDDEQQSSVLPDLWKILRHPIRSIKEDRQAPRTSASLFNYISGPAKTAPVNWKELIRDLLIEYRTPLYIPSIWSNQDELVSERAVLRTRRMESGLASLLIYASFAGFVIFAAVHKNDPPPEEQKVVEISQPMDLPPDGNNGGGGGGGGKNEKLPANIGRMPEAMKVQYMPPDPGQPKPLEPKDLDMRPAIVLPVDIPADALAVLGDMVGPPGAPLSSGPGTGGGIGTGHGTGIGSGNGPGYGPGSGGGMGGGNGGGIGNGNGPYVVGNGVTDPIALFQPKPAYTEEARKARTEGVLVLQAVIRKDGSVDSFTVVKGLGYGLDESAINTIATKWKFKPGTLKGVAVDVWSTIEVTFRLY